MAPNFRTAGIGHKWKDWKFHLNIRGKKSNPNTSTVNVTKHWDRLPREVLESPSLEILMPMWLWPWATFYSLYIPFLKTSAYGIHLRSWEKPKIFFMLSKLGNLTACHLNQHYKYWSHFQWLLCFSAANEDKPFGTNLVQKKTGIFLQGTIWFFNKYFII